MIDDQHSPQTNHTGHDQHAAAHLLSPAAPPDGQPNASHLAATASTSLVSQPFSHPPPHPTPHPALLAAVPSSAPSSSSPSSLSSRVNTFRSACLDCLISHQTHHLIPHSSKVVIFDSKLKVSHAFDGLVTHDINCFPASDTRVLTDRGFAFLEEIEEREAAGDTVLYGCYDVASRGLVYRPGELVFDQRLHKQLVSFASPDEAHRWDNDRNACGADCSGEEAEGEADNIDPSISLRVTPQHLMYSQAGQLDCNSGSTCDWDRLSPTHRPAESLLPTCRCPPLELHCGHRYAATRLVALAESGYAPTVVGVKEGCSNESPVANALQLSDTEQWTAFLSLFGFWLGDGSLQYDENGQLHSLLFGLRRRRERTWLADQLRAVGLREACFLNEIDSWHVTDKRWLDWFDQQFGAQDAASHALHPTLHNNARDPIHLPLSPTASLPSSPAASPSSSQLSHCFDDDLGPFDTPISPHDQPDQTDSRKRKRNDPLDRRVGIDTSDSTPLINAGSDHEDVVCCSKPSVTSHCRSQSVVSSTVPSF